MKQTYLLILLFLIDTFIKMRYVEFGADYEVKTKGNCVKGKR